jgi:hypothetical protein
MKSYPITKHIIFACIYLLRWTWAGCQQSLCCLLLSSFLFGLFFDLKKPEIYCPETSVDFHRTTRRYILERITLRLFTLSCDTYSEPGDWREVKNIGPYWINKGRALRHEGVWRSGCIDPHFLELGISWRWIVSFTIPPFYPRGKKPWYPSDRRLSGPYSWSGRRGEEKIRDPTGTRTPTPRSSSL